MPDVPIRLMSLAHGGGCGCKLAPSVLTQIMASQPATSGLANLLVGTETADDAAVYRINPEQAIVATTDFFMPVVDDPYDFGRIAATNALSDVYAMGAEPILALAVVGVPVNALPVETIRAVLEGGAAVCAQAGIPVAGGHSIDSPEPIYGLVALGLVHPDRVKRNSGACEGDVLVLGKPLGIGILSAALKKGALSSDGYAELIATTTQLNTVGTLLGERAEVHAMTDVTGFGLLGHLLEVCRGSGLAACLDWSSVPVMPIARELAERGFNTGAATRNWASYGEAVHLPGQLHAWERNLLCDPQTSGGLLTACSSAAVGDVLDLLRQGGCHRAACIGSLATGPSEITVAA
jgi:selenide, water dikinase